MLLHLGKDNVIPLRDIIAIIDKESAFKSDFTRDFFELAEKNGDIENISKDIKTYILTDRVEKKKGAQKPKIKSIIYTSNISSNTLKKRAGFLDGIENVSV